MQKLFVISLIASIVFTGAYWYTLEASLCRYPIAYRIGELDERFDLTYEQARTVVHDAEVVWEEATETELFSYNPDAAFAINFVFDDRQELSDEERAAREALEALEAENVALTEQYTQLTARHRNLQQSHDQSVMEYEMELANHNERVEELNAQGGADPEQFQALEANQQALEATAEELNNQVERINQLAAEINRAGDEGNALIEEYNQMVAAYNARFGTSREFTQGDYRGDRINIYTFAHELELQQVLVHELGHAIGLEHVDDPQAIMYHLMGTQPDELQITDADLDEFARICGDGPGVRGLLTHYSQFLW